MDWRDFFSLAFRILWKKNEVADYEATTFSIFYNNTLFLVLVIIASFFLLKNFNPTVYPFSRVSLSTDYIISDFKDMLFSFCACLYTTSLKLNTVFLTDLRQLLLTFCYLLTWCWWTCCHPPLFLGSCFYLNSPFFPSNYILSISASSGLIALLSTGSK